MAIDAKQSSDGTKIEIVNDSDDSVVGHIAAKNASIAGAEMSYDSDASGPKVRIDVGTGSKKQIGIYLDSDGHLNNVCPILFEAYIDTSDADVVAGTRPSWTSSIDTAPTGYGFSADSDSYIIPKDGYYEIHLSILQESAAVGSSFDIWLYLDRNGQAHSGLRRMLYANNVIGTYEQVSNMTYVELVKGDRIFIRSQGTRGWWGNSERNTAFLSSWKLRYLGAQE